MFKNLKYLILLLLTIGVSSIFAVAPTDGTADSYYYWVIDDQEITVGDTLSITDSITLLSHFSPKKGWEYVLSRDAFTGSGADSAKVAIVVDAYDASKNKYRRVSIDSATAAAGEDYIIPFGTTLFGKTFTVKLINYNGGTVVIIPNNFFLTRRTNYIWSKQNNIPWK